MADILQVVGQWITGMIGWVSDAVNGIVGLFYTESETGAGKLTFIGVLAVFGIAVGLVGLGIAFVRGFVQK